MLKYSILFLFPLFLLNCATINRPDNEQLKLISESDYLEILENKTQRKQIYSGLYNTIDLSSSILTSDLYKAQNDQMARIFLWDNSKYTQENVSLDQKLSKETEIFVSFFTPERKHDDLHKNKTLWKIFLDCGGKRYEGKATKIKLLTEEVQGIFPYHNRFSTPYTVKFPVPMKQIEINETAKLTITGPVGSVTVDFNLKSPKL